MKSINFDEGYKEYKINDDDSRIIRIRVADPNLLSRFAAARDKIDELQRKYAAAAPEDMAAADVELRRLLNEVFDTDICTPAFGAAALLTLTENGKPLYEAFFEAFLPELRADIEAVGMSSRINAPEPPERVQKYLDPPVSAPAVKPIAGLARPYDDGLPDVSGYTPEQKKQLLMKLMS